MTEPLVGILVGSASDRERMQDALDELDARGIAWEFEVRSAHRDPEAVAEYSRSASGRGLRVLICGAGLAAAAVEEQRVQHHGSFAVQQRILPRASGLRGSRRAAGTEPGAPRRRR
jgi:hypothetical protein